MNELDLGQIHMYSIGIHDVSQILDSIHAEWALFQIGVQLVLAQSIEDLLNVLQVLFPCSVVDEDII